MYTHIQWECSVLRAPCILLQACKACMPRSCRQMGLRRARRVMSLPRWQHPAITHCKGAQSSWLPLGRDSKNPCVLWVSVFLDKYKVYIDISFEINRFDGENAACKKLTASVSSPCFCLTSEKHFQSQDLKALFSCRNKLLKGACDCWLIWSMLS